MQKLLTQEQLKKKFPLLTYEQFDRKYRIKRGRVEDPISISMTDAARRNLSATTVTQTRQAVSRAINNVPTKMRQGINQIRIASPAELGKEDGKQITGKYRNGKNGATITVAPSTNTERTVYHEVAHNTFTNDKELQREFQRYSNQQKQRVSEYARTGTQEHFAEVVAYYFTDPKKLRNAEPQAYRMIENYVRGQKSK